MDLQNLHFSEQCGEYKARMACRSWSHILTIMWIGQDHNWLLKRHLILHERRGITYYTSSNRVGWPIRAQRNLDVFKQTHSGRQNGEIQSRYF